VRARLGNAAGKLFSGLDPSNIEKFSVDSTGNLKIAGVVKFPDGTTQTTSARAGNTVIVVGSANVTPGSFNEVLVNCPASFHAVSGGMDSGDILLVEQTASSPIINGMHIRDLVDGQYSAATGWLVAAHNTDTVNTFIMKAAVVCAPD
jgi:hypothetical protein